MLHSRAAKSVFSVALVAVAIFSHLCFLALGEELWCWDTGVFNLVAEDVSRGKFSAFYYNHSYGGAVLSLVHGFWLFLLRIVWPSAGLMAHHTFHYAVVPSLLAISTFWLVAEYISVGVGFVVALIPAVGILSWILFYSATEYYIAGFLLGSLLLILRHRWGDPWKVMSATQRFGVAVLAGFSIYTYRATLVYVVAIAIPWSWVRQELQVLLRARGRVIGILRGAAIGLFSAYLLLDILGTRVGVFHGRLVKLSGRPNLDYALFLAVPTWAWLRRGKLFTAATARLIMPAVAGVLVGLSPELISCLLRGEKPGGGAGIASLDLALRVLIQVPDRLREMMSSSAEIPYGLTGQTPLHLASFVLVVLGITELWRRAREDEKLKYLPWACVLALVSFVLVSSYTMGATRWLFSSLPIFLLGIGYFLERAKRRGLLPLAGAALLLALHFGNQVLGRSAIIHEVRGRSQRIAEWTMGRVETMRSVISTFQREGVNVVLSHEYFWTNNLSVISGGKPIFLSDIWTPTESFRLAETEPLVGLIVKASDPLPFEFLGVRYTLLKKLDSVEAISLWVARRN